MQCLTSDLFKDFPTLRFIIPHGGGAVPYHWGRFRGLAQELKKPLLKDHLLKNIFFDTCVYHQPGIDLLTKVIPVDNILFASEMIGAVRGIDPETGHYYDDTKRYIEASTIVVGDDRHKIYEGNARRVFPRLDAALEGEGEVSMYELGIVKRNIARADRAAVEQLGTFGSATVHEAMGRVGLMKPYMRPIYAGAHACGTAVTVLLQPGDNWMMHVAAEQIRAGRHRRRGLHRRQHRRLLRRPARDQLPGARRASAWSSTAACRDVKDLTGDAVPGLEPRDQRQGHRQGDARLGQHPGRLRRHERRTRATWCVADDDGVVVVPAAIAQKVADAAAAREANEGEKRAKLASGVLGLDMYKMREPLEAAGLKYID